LRQPRPPVPDGWTKRNGKEPDRREREESEVDVASEEEGEADVDRLLDGVPLEVQEAWVCEDLMFALQVRDHSKLVRPRLTDIRVSRDRYCGMRRVMILRIKISGYKAPDGVWILH
jgi:hypothetical protein